MNFTNFDELNIKFELLKAIADMGFENPTAVQAEVIPHILEGRDVLATAPTGTGKTCAFGLPMIDGIDVYNKKVQALVLCPTRELAMQITDELRKLITHISGLKIATLYGGQPIGKQFASLRKNPQIVVGTPGRVLDHLRRQTLMLDELSMLVLDEADEMLNMGFREDIEVVVDSAPAERQTVMFSATMPPEIKKISQKYQEEPLFIKIELKKEDMPKIRQIGIRARKNNKSDKLMELIEDKNFYLGLIFCNTKSRTDKVTELLNDEGYTAEALHGDVRQSLRTKIMRKFREHDIQYLVATDVAARGIDVDDIDAIINYDLPLEEESYTHRIGRTGRANKKGVAYTFYCENEVVAINKYAEYTGGEIELDEKDVITNLDNYTLKKTKKGRKSQKDLLAKSDRERGERGGRGDRDRDGRERGGRCRDERGGRGDRDRDGRGRDDRGGRGDRDRDGRGRDERGGRGDRDRDGRGRDDWSEKRESRGDKSNRRGDDREQRRERPESPYAKNSYKEDRGQDDNDRGRRSRYDEDRKPKYSDRKPYAAKGDDSFDNSGDESQKQGGGNFDKFIKKPTPAPAKKQSKKFSINIGAEDSINSASVLGLITKCTTIKSGSVGKIDVKDNATIVEINSIFCDDISLLNGLKIAKKKLRVEQVEVSSKKKGDRSFGDKKGKKGGKKDFGKRDFGKRDFEKRDSDKKEYGDRGFDKKDFGKRDFEKRDFEKRDSDKRDFGKRDFEKRDSDKKDFGKKDFGKKEYGKKDFGKKSSNKKDFGKKNYGKKDSYKKR